MLSRCSKGDQKPTYYVYLHFMFLSHCQKGVDPFCTISYEMRVYFDI